MDQIKPKWVPGEHSSLAEPLLAAAVLPQHSEQLLGRHGAVARYAVHLCQTQLPRQEVHVTGQCAQSARVKCYYCGFQINY